jgi:hypothetical protein
MKAVLLVLIILFTLVLTITAQSQLKNDSNEKYTTKIKSGFNISPNGYQQPPTYIKTLSDSCPAGQATDPNPMDGAADVSIFLSEVNWVNGSGATSIEVFFDGVSVYSGPPVTSYTIPGSLRYSTLYNWQVNSSDDSDTKYGFNWSFTTEWSPLLTFETVKVYPQSFPYWTGTTDGTNKTDNSLVRGLNTEDGWFMFDITSIAGAVEILQVTLNGYVNSTNWPYWSATPLPGLNPLTATAAELKAAAEANSADGTAYVYSNESSSFNTGQYSYLTESWTNTDLLAAVSQGWFAMGMDSRDNSTSYWINWDGWNQSNIPYLEVEYSICLGCPNAPSDLTAIAQYENGSYVLLNWVDNSYDETFHIERKLGNIYSTNEYAEIATVGANVTSYIDYTVADTTMYTYRVRAIVPWGASSGYSNQAEVMTLIPVELISFKANISDGNVKLYWSTATETNNLGFEIYRTIKNNEQSWQKIGFVQGLGTTTEVQSYSFTDKSTLSGNYLYRLKQIDYDGSYEYSNIIEVEVLNPTEFSLEQNYPNPFNPGTTIKFMISSALGGGFTILKVYDVLGNEVAVLVNEEKQAGIYEVEFSNNNLNLTSGVYYYQLIAGSYIATKKMMILK